MHNIQISQWPSPSFSLAFFSLITILFQLVCLSSLLLLVRCLYHCNQFIFSWQLSSYWLDAHQESDVCLDPLASTVFLLLIKSYCLTSKSLVTWSHVLFIQWKPSFQMTLICHLHFVTLMVFITVLNLSTLHANNRCQWSIL